MTINSKKGIETHTVTLHVGLGTFKNISEEDIRDYVMHAERAEIPVSIFETIAMRKQEQKNILAVGTTVTRTLESLPYLWNLIRDDIDCSTEVREFWNQKTLVREVNPLSSVSFSPDRKTLFFRSALFIYGEYPFQVVDEIITNFHLPKSTLFILVSSFLGRENAQEAYRYAIEHMYRFFSFGDAMYLKKSKNEVS
ncbi:MAG: S-adenosylmethionine:tRNA ribosyltransferase-isomerase [Candidatus Gracilibacteria bacterium]|nr:S-adenosylmethionine:tRNA ribosyltransferase-isomerase [Candidatus Gracilibacteria bacterium]